MTSRGRETAERGVEAASATAERTIETAAEAQTKAMGAVKDQIARTGEIYRDVAEVTTEDTRALVSASTALADGMQHLQRSWIDMVRKSFERASSLPNDLMHCQSLNQIAEIQRQYITRNFDDLLAGSAEWLKISSQIAQDASRSLESRVENRSRPAGRGQRDGRQQAEARAVH